MFTKLEVVFAGCLLSASAVWAQDSSVVWRCGNEYTNQPKTGQVCTKVQVQADVVTTAPRKFHAVPQTAAPQVPTTMLLDGARVDGATQRSRDQHAQQILNDELSKQQRRCQKLTAQSTEMVRCLADEAALRRELARLP